MDLTHILIFYLIIIFLIYIYFVSHYIYIITILFDSCLYMNLLKVLNSLSDVNASNLKNVYTATIQFNTEYGAVTFEMIAPSNIYMFQVSQNQGMRLILAVPRGTSAKMMRHELQMLPVEHRAKLSI